MSRLVFQMWEPKRKQIIDLHKFYYQQANSRLLAQFRDIEGESDAAADKYFEERSAAFHPERHDPADVYEGAWNANIEHFGLLEGMRDDTRMALIAGIFHQWDKDLRDLLAKESRHFGGGDTVRAQIWKVNFDEIMEMLDGMGWQVRTRPYFAKLDACRLVVNVFKHGPGGALDNLCRDYPEYLRGAFGTDRTFPQHVLYHTDIRITDEHFAAFSTAIIAFWDDFPSEVEKFHHQPQWLVKALNKDARQ